MPDTAGPRHGLPTRRSRGRRLLRWMVVPSRSGFALAVILGLVAMGVVMQVRRVHSDADFSTARREDLVQLLDGVTSESRRLEAELDELNRTRAQLESGADAERVAREQARKRLSDLAILAGTAPAEGPGVRITIQDPAGKVSPELMLNAIEELRDAGAEVIEIDDEVRVQTRTSFGGAAGATTADGTLLGSPITIEAIGDPHSLETAVRFRGGLVSEVTGPNVEGQALVEQRDRVSIDSVVGAPAGGQPTPAPTTTPS